MAKLTRKHIKVFAANAQIADIGQFGSGVAGTKVQTGDIEQIQALDAWQNGWADGVVSNNRYPALQERNGIDKVLSYELAYLLQNGIAEYDSNTTYYIGSFVRQANTSNVYVSLTDDNLGNLLTDTINWKKIPLDYIINYGNTAITNLAYNTEFVAADDGMLVWGANYGLTVDPTNTYSLYTVRGIINEQIVFQNKNEINIPQTNIQMNFRYDTYGTAPISKGQKFKLFTYENMGLTGLFSHILILIPKII